MTSELVERAQRGDHEAFDALAGAAYHRMYAIARRILRDGYAAEDAVQDALVRAWRDLRALRDRDRFDAWLHRLLVNACMDHVKRRKRRSVEVPSLDLDPGTPDDGLGQLVDRDELERAFLQLPVEPARCAGPHLLRRPDRPRGRSDPRDPGRDRRIHDSTTAHGRCARRSRPRPACRPPARSPDDERIHRTPARRLAGGGPRPGPEPRPRSSAGSDAPDDAATGLGHPRTVAPDASSRFGRRSRRGPTCSSSWVPLLVVALAGALFLIGSQRHPAPPFGLAGNGSIVVGVDGHLWLADSRRVERPAALHRPGVRLVAGVLAGRHAAGVQDPWCGPDAVVHLGGRRGRLERQVGHGRFPGRRLRARRHRMGAGRLGDRVQLQRSGDQPAVPRRSPRWTTSGPVRRGHRPLPTRRFPPTANGSPTRSARGRLRRGPPSW